MKFVGTDLEQALVVLPRAGAQVLKQAALMSEGEVEGEVAAVLAVPHLTQEIITAASPTSRIPSAANASSLCFAYTS